MKFLEEMAFDLDFARPKVIVCENLVILENVSAIVMLSDTSITVNNGKKYTTIAGMDFNIKEIYEGRLLVEGKIQRVEFLQP